jgi:hypothetical protein
MSVTGLRRASPERPWLGEKWQFKLTHYLRRSRGLMAIGA